jgi:hypothetical protein
LLVTTSFSGLNRMDNLLKDHRCPTLAAFFAARVGFADPDPRPLIDSVA